MFYSLPNLHYTSFSVTSFFLQLTVTALLILTLVAISTYYLVVCRVQYNGELEGMLDGLDVVLLALISRLLVLLSWC